MLRLFREIHRFLVRASAFIGKEIVEVVRQTPLILTLVLGPFLIMLLFGIGYRNDVHPLRTLIVMNVCEPLQPQVENMATSLGQNIIYKGITSDKDAAMQELRRGNLDLVAVIPPDALETIRNNQQATVQFYHNKIDPYQVSYMEYFGRAYIDEANRRIVRGYAEKGQEDASSLEQSLTNAHQRVAAMGRRCRLAMPRQLRPSSSI